MKNLKYCCLVIVIALISVHSADAGSSVWKVTQKDRHIFIGGTIHVLTQSDYPLPPAYEEAYRQSTKIVFETDLRVMQSPEFKENLGRKVIYSDGRSLKTVLSEAKFKELELYLSKRGLPMTTMVNFKPGMVAMTLTMIELQRLGFMPGTGVDFFFNLKALNDHKKLGYLETAQEQVDFIVGMGDGCEDEFIDYTLRDLGQLPEMMKFTKDAWRRGDNQAFKEKILLPLKNKFPEVYAKLIVKRNNAWLPEIIAMLKTKEPEFVLVGALHLVGDDGLLHQLAARGCKLEMQK